SGPPLAWPCTRHRSRPRLLLTILSRCSADPEKLDDLSAQRRSAPDVVARRVPEGRGLGATHRGRLDVIASSRLRPCGPVLPPRAAVPGGGGAPLIGARRGVGGRLKPRFKSRASSP